MCWAVKGDNRYYHAILDGGPCYIVHPSDMAPALIALETQIHLLGRQGPRSLLLEEFFVTTVQRLYQENVLERGEIITALRVPSAPAETEQVKGSICLDCRVVLGGVSPRPYRAIAAEADVNSKPLTGENIQQAAAAALANAKPMTMNAYKLDLARGLVVRAFQHVA